MFYSFVYSNRAVIYFLFDVVGEVEGVGGLFWCELVVGGWGFHATFSLRVGSGGVWGGFDCNIHDVWRVATWVCVVLAWCVDR